MSAQPNKNRTTPVGVPRENARRICGDGSAPFWRSFSLELISERSRRTFIIQNHREAVSPLKFLGNQKCKGKMKIEIKSRWSGSVLFSLETDSWKVALEAAVKRGADLRGANLRGANLRGADLRGANLRGADLRDANLCGADLRGADLRDANLCGADLRGADLRGANLRGANLRGANLRGANLRGANLRDANLRGADLRGADLRDANLRGADLRDADLCGADLRGADLRDADLTGIRDDIWAVLCSAPREVESLRLALIEGRVDGSTYEGKCACLVGTLANARQCGPTEIPSLKPNASRPAERFFMGIKKGDTPETNQFSKLALQWVDEWLANMRSAFGPVESAPASKI
jgi:uncharacterized protein YjbI with pentapeptide repeats